MRFVRGISRAWTATIPSFVPGHQTPADGDVDSDDEGEDDDFTAERILADKPDPGTPRERL